MNIRMHLAVHEADAVPVARALVKIEVFQPVEPKESKEEKWRQLEKRLEQQDDRLGRVCIMLGIAAEMAPGEASYSCDPVENEEKNRRLLDEVEGQLASWQAARRKLTEERERLDALAENLRCLESAGISFPATGENRYLDLRFGWMPADQYDRPAFPALRTPLVIIPLLQCGDRLMVGAATMKANGYVLERVLASLFVKPVDISGKIRHPQKRLRALDSCIGNDKERQRLAERWRENLLLSRSLLREDLQAVRLIARYGLWAPEGYCQLAGDIPGKMEERIFQLIREAAAGPHAIFAGKSMKEK